MPWHRDTPRKAARAAGQLLYVGSDCPKNHGGERYVSSGCCVRCHRQHGAAFYAEHPEYHDAARKKYRAQNPGRENELVCAARAQNPEKFRAKSRRIYMANAEHYRQYKRDYYSKNREQERARHDEWARNNRPYMVAKQGLRRAAFLRRIAKWADNAAIKEFYRRADELTLLTGIKHAVDHIIPLQGELVSGLHVENNLQVLTLAANSAKSNRYEVA